MKSSIIHILRRAAAWIRGHRGEIIYYSCVLGALTVIAVGAEQYRRNRVEPQPVSLPAVEIAQPQSGEAEFILPEGLRLIHPFSDAPQWNSMDQSWQAHPAADYASEDGCIRAFSDGTVIEVGKSAILGGYVLIENGEIHLKYCSIAPEAELEPGENIRRGEVLGSAAETMPGEMHLGAHLHLEARRAGTCIDPETLLQTGD